MRLFVYSYNYHPEPTGIGAYNASMCRWYHAHLGWEVRVHTGIPHYPWWKVPEGFLSTPGWRTGYDHGVFIDRVRHYIPHPPITGRKRLLLDASWLMMTLLRSFSSRNRPSAILVVSPPFLSGMLALFLRWRWRVPVIYHIQDLQVDAAIELKMLPKAFGSTLHWVERFILSRCDLVTTVSESMMARVASKGKLRRQVRLFPNWADTASIKPHTGGNAYREEWRKDWGLSVDDVVVAYSGSIGSKQGLDVLVAAAARCSLPRGRLWLVIAGEGVERASLERQAAGLRANQIRFMSLAPAERLSEFLCAADIHCIIQRRLAADLVMPSKLLNMMATARPVLATADPSTSLGRVIEASGCGILVPPENEAALAKALTDLAADPDRRARFGVLGRKYVSSRLDQKDVLRRFSSRLLRITHRSNA